MPGRASAYFSTTDDRDETARRVYGVIGRLDSERPELRPHVVALWPGLTRTELVMANPQLSPFAERVGHSPQMTGRAVAALAGDPAIIDKTGQSIDVRNVALAYGFTDLDGTLPPPR